MSKAVTIICVSVCFLVTQQMALSCETNSLKFELSARKSVVAREEHTRMRMMLLAADTEMIPVSGCERSIDGGSILVVNEPSRVVRALVCVIRSLMGS